MPAACPVCRLPLIGEQAFELWGVDTRLQALHAEINLLLQRRSVLLHQMRQTAPQYSAPDRLGDFAVRNLLLIIGAGLLAIASLVFTVVSWGHLGLPAKATILTSLAAVALALPWPLTKKGLKATGEAIGMLGLLLVILECYAAYSYGLFEGADPRWYSAMASFVITGGWVVYARFSPLVFPKPAAVVLAQFPLLLVVFALQPTALEFASALIFTSLLDLLGRRDRVTLIAGAVTGMAGLLLAIWDGLWKIDDLAAALRIAPVLLGATLVAAVWSYAVDRRISAVAGAAMVFAAGVPAAAAVQPHWKGLAFALASALVILIGRAAPERFSTGLWKTGAFFLGGTGVLALFDAVPAIAHLAHLDAESPLIFALIAVITFAARRRTTGLIFLALAVSSIPDLAGLGLPASLVLQLALTAGLLALAIALKSGDFYVGLATAAVAISWSLDSEVATVTTLSAVFLLLTATAILLDQEPVPALAAVLTAGWLCGAAADLAGLQTPPEVYTAPVTLGGLLLGWLWRERLGSSWQAYGPALAITFVPSLLLMADQDGWQRPLLLGLSALVVTLAGLQYRQQAPALIGGVTLLLVAAHELAPGVAQLLGFMPRWVPIAVAGLLVMALGATYERRLGELRRLHGRFSTMH